MLSVLSVRSSTAASKQQASSLLLFQNWVQAVEDHLAYSTHYCTQEQLSDDEEDEHDDAVSVAELQASLKVSRIADFCISLNAEFAWLSAGALAAKCTLMLPIRSIRRLQKY